MRVIAGSARGVPLKGPPRPSTRATADKVRGAIFDALVLDLDGARVLDLYAGTGALGIEALSRGAATCLFVEKAASVCRIIAANLGAARLAEQGLVLRLPVMTALERLERPFSHADMSWAPEPVTVPSTFAPPYDVIVVDPPYDDPGKADVIERLSRSRLVAQGGFVVLEHSKRWQPPHDPGPLRLRRARRYGDTGVIIWQYKEDAEG